MLRGEFESVDERSVEDLHRAYHERIRTVVESAGVDGVVDRSAVDRETVGAVADGEQPELTLETAAAILAVDEDLPDADAIVAEARDILLMGMTTAVVDVDAVSAGVDGAMEPKEIQQKVEGRYPITLGEYAQIHRFIESKQ
jgi:hypothetical protein